MKVKELFRNILRALGNHILVYLINIFCMTYRIKEINGAAVESAVKSSGNMILGFWHGTMLIPWYMHRGGRFSALVSQSRDGDLLASVLKKWKYRVIRGSSSSGGREALDIMIENAERGFSVSITPDGPRGPKRELKAGIVISAKKSGRPIVLMGAGYERKWKLNSWDGFEIPKPFSRINVIYSDPIMVDKDLGYEETSEMIEECGVKLNRLQNEAEKF